MEWTDCPLVDVNPEKVIGVPILRGTRMPAEAILENYTDGLAADEIAEVFQLPAESVRGLLAYAVRHIPAFEPREYYSTTACPHLCATG
jgi:uncharacterized protein (DUF433 family)